VDDHTFHAQVGAMTIHRTDTGVELRADLLPSSRNGVDLDVAHGGVVATILDSALAFALVAQDDRDWSTVDLRLDYLRSVRIGTVTAVARVVQAGRRVGRAEGELVDADGNLCARAVGTFVPVD
jgi:uncharacterized protein (TIGR00369 family)